MSKKSCNQNHQNNNHPIDRVFDDSKIDWKAVDHLGSLVAIVVPSFSTEAQNHEAEQHHQDNGDPVCNVPMQNSCFGHEYSKSESAKELICAE